MATGSLYDLLIQIFRPGLIISFLGSLNLGLIIEDLQLMMVSYDVISGLDTLGIQELFSYCTLMLYVLVRSEGTCVYKSEPLISALTQKPTLTPINAYLIKIVRHVLLHFLEQIPVGNPSDTSWPLNRQLPVSSQLTPDSCGLVFVV